jgi:hypothetical protein
LQRFKFPRETEFSSRKTEFSPGRQNSPQGDRILPGKQNSPQGDRILPRETEFSAGRQNSLQGDRILLQGDRILPRETEFSPGRQNSLQGDRILPRETEFSQGDRILPKRGKDGKFHAPGELRVIGKDSLHDLFMLLQPVFKAIKGFKGIILSPLPRYIWHRCCENPSHITNSENPTFASDMGKGLKDLTVNLRNMIFMRKLCGVSIMNTVESLGIVPDAEGRSLDIERVLAIWGSDPVHPSPAAYRILAGKIAEKIEQVLADPQGDDRHGASAMTEHKQDPRDSWVSGSQPIAKRAEP